MALPAYVTDERRDRLVKETKERLSGEELCQGVLLKEFATYINYVRGLSFDDKPDYSYLQRLFRNLFKAQGFKYDHIYDWTQKLFDEMQAEMDNEGEVTPNEGVAKAEEGPEMAN